MPLYDNPPHRITVQSVASGTDAGGGVTLSTTTVQTGLKCSINTTGSSERELFAQEGITVTHRVAVLSSLLTAPIQRGWQIVAEDTGATFLVQGISRGRAYGRIPSFTYLDVSEQL